MRYHLLTPPAVEPVSGADLMAFARVDADPGDGVLQRLLLAARQRVERDTGLALITQTFVAILDRWPAMAPPDVTAAMLGAGVGTCGSGGWSGLGGWNGVRGGSVAGLGQSGVIEITRRPFAALLAFQVRDATSALGNVDPASFLVEAANGTARIAPRAGAVWPLVPCGLVDGIELTVSLGFGATPASVPADLQSAILMLAAHWYAAREPALEGRVGSYPEHVRSILSSWQGRRLR